MKLRGDHYEPGSSRRPGRRNRLHGSYIAGRAKKRRREYLRQLSKNFQSAEPATAIRFQTLSSLSPATIDSQKAQSHSQRESDKPANGASHNQRPVLAARLGLHADPDCIGKLLFGEIRMGLANARDQFLVGRLHVRERFLHLRDKDRLIFARVRDKLLHAFEALEQLSLLRLDAFDLHAGVERPADEKVIEIG